MGTKFHHYIFPVVPPIAMLVGITLDRMLGPVLPVRSGALAGYLFGLTAGVALLVLGVACSQAGSILGTKPGGRLAEPSIAGAAALCLAGMLVLGALLWSFRTKKAAESDPTREHGAGDAHAARSLAAGAVSAALLLVLIVRDLVTKPENADQPGAIRLLQLFSYNYRRHWPDSLDFRAALLGFGVVAVLGCAALAVRVVRGHAVAAMGTLGFLWALWGVDVYMEKTAPHWGQREVIEAYYGDRSSADELLVAYQMNWKGENFYTGNRIPAFKSTGAAFTSWIEKKREEGIKVMYFLTEHGRVGGLKSEVRGKAYRELTDKTLCDKFVLVRAEL
jgi:hypothetical protein